MNKSFDWLKAYPHEKQVYINSIREFLAKQEQKPVSCNKNKESETQKWWRLLSIEKKEAYLERKFKLKEFHRRGTKIVYMPPEHTKIGDCECTWIDYYRVHSNGRIDANPNVRRRLKKQKT